MAEKPLAEKDAAGQVAVELVAAAKKTVAEKAVGKILGTSECRILWGSSVLRRAQSFKEVNQLLLGVVPYLLDLC